MRAAAVLFGCLALAAAMPVHAQNSPYFDDEEAALSAKFSGDYALARAKWQSEFLHAQQRRDETTQSYALNNIAKMSQALEQYDAAYRAFSQALSLDRKNGMWLNEAGDLNSLAVLDFQMGRYDDAIRVEQEDLSLFKSLKNGVDIAHASLNIGNVLFSLGRYDAALAQYTQALALYRKNDLYGNEKSDMASAMGNIGLVYRLQGRERAAIAEYRQALKLESTPCAQSRYLLNMSVVEYDLNTPDAAMLDARRAAQVSSGCHDLQGQAYADQTIAYLEVRVGSAAAAEEARRLGSESAQLAKRIGLADLLWKSEYVTAEADAMLPDRRDEAIAAYRSTLDVIEQLRTGLESDAERVLYFQNKLFAYDAFIAYLRDLDRQFPEQGYAAEALQVLERKNARVLLEQIGLSAAHRFSGVPAAVVREEDDADAGVDAQRTIFAQLSAEPNHNDEAIASAEQRLTAQLSLQSSVRSTIAKDYPQYFALRHPQPLDVKALQRSVLRDDEAMLVYDLLPDAGSLWIIRRDRLQLFSLPPETLIRSQVERLRSHTAALETLIANGALNGDVQDAANDDAPRFAADAYALWQSLVPPPAQPLIRDVKRLIVVPSGALYAVPWEALATEMPDAGQQPHYLIEDHAVSYVSSASLLGVVRTAYANRHRAPEPLIAFARPAYGTPRAGSTLEYGAVRAALNGRFADLPGTEIEAEAVRDALHAPAASIYSGERATKSELLRLNQTGRLRENRYVLFATHAVVPDPAHGVSEPALVLAHPQRDGLFTMGEVFQLTLNADLVELSACNTGTVGATSAEGIGGLTRAFLFAGTPAVSVTLWEVDDRAAPQLSAVFFSRMESGSAPDEALREAKLALIRSGDPRLRHPFAWAPSVIFGDASSVL